MDSSDHQVGYHAQLQQIGYRTVPIIPGNLVAADGAVIPHGAGKAPGIKLPDGRWVHLKNWQQIDPADPHAPLSIEKAREYDDMGAGTGLLCGVQGLVGIDVDLINPIAADVVRTFASICFQKQLPIRSVDHPDHIKYTMLVRVINDAGQPVSVSSVGDIGVSFPGDAELNTHGQPIQRKVQIIGARRQFVAFGIHPLRQRLYVWDTSVATLGAPDVAADQMKRFFYELPERLVEAGGIVTHPRSETYRNDPGQALHDAVYGELKNREEKILQVAGWSGLAGDLLVKLEDDFLRDPALAKFWETGRGANDNDISASGRIMKLAYWLAHKRRYCPEDFACLVRIWRFSYSEDGRISASADFRAIARAWTRAVHAAQAPVWSAYAPMPRTGVPELLPLVVVPEDDAQTVVLRPAEINDDDDDDDDDDDPPVPQQPFGRDTRPVVRIRDNEMSDVVAETCTHLAAADLGLFDRAHTLVHVLEDAGPTAVPGITTTFFTMARLSPHTLWSAMAKAAAFQNYDGRKRRWKNTKPPEKIAHVIIDSPDAWSFPKLDAIHSCQTLREDGSVVMHDGYDPGMRTLFRDLPALAPLPEDITYQHAQTALALLADLLKEFPFVDNEPDGSVKSGRDSASFAAAVAALMTAVLRPMLGSVPLFALTSSEPGSGKSYLWDCLSMIVSGDACPVIGAAISPEETDKQLSSALMDGRPLICFDNVNGAFGSSLICQANSQPRITLRVLGASELKTIRNRTLMLATGNNIRIRDDLVRRTLLITLDARMENPEKREFAQNPLAMITADRGTYIRACLIIARWYADIGLLDKLLPIGGYGAWSDHVRSALVALGLADPWLTQETARNTDPVREARREVLGHLHRAFGEHPTTVADMLTVAETDAELKQALTGGCAGPRGVLSSQSLRGWLMRNKSTRRDGFLLAATQPQTRHKGAGVFWTVMLTNSAPLSLFPESDHRGQQDL